MAKFGIGPAIEDGFYYDFEVGRPFTPEDLDAIEERMRQIVAEEKPFKRTEIDRLEAWDAFEEQPFKRELIAELPEDETISTYSQGSFTDLCRGPHVPTTGKHRRLQAHEDRRRLLARRLRPADASAHLRHRVVHAEGPRRLPHPHRGGREARPPQARQGARPVQLPRGGRRRPAALPPQGRARAAPDAGVAARRALRARLRRGHHAAHLQDRRLEDQRALRLLRREHVLLRDRRGRRPGQRVRASSR